MLSQPAITYALLPLVLGGIVTSTCLFIPRLQHLAGLGIAFGLVTIYVLGEGNIVFPPIAAKHKIVFLIPVIGILSPFLTSKPARTVNSIILVYLIAGLSWMVFRKYTLSPPDIMDMVLALCVFCTSFLVVSLIKKRPTYDIQLGVSLQVSLIVGAVTALVGGFLGIGQLLGSIAAFWGGAMLVVYAAILSGFSAAKTSVFLLSALTALTPAFAITFLMLGSYATNLSQLAYLLCLLILGMPLLLGSFVSNFSKKIQPFISSAFAGVPAILAIYFAARHF